jgi:endonuclease/exonuclease/phosphatase (EEP) superfamily protein YafD
VAVIAISIFAIGSLLVLLTLPPLLPSNERWIRIWDFPRLQIAALSAGTLLAAFIVLPLADHPTRILLASLALSLAWQLWRIWPYTPLHAVQVEGVQHCPALSRLKILIANVRRDNRESGPLLELIRTETPHLALLVETDRWWDAQLEELAPSYPQRLSRPQDNTYGMHLLSKLPLESPEVRFLLDDDIPSFKAGLRLPRGPMIVLYCVHPRPPPRADTAKRDAELVMIGREIRSAAERAIVAGDLNDVAWSRTTHLFQEVSGLLDPRIGRGLYATFSARSRLLRWPLDHVFFSPVFRLERLSVLPGIGSDHFPLLLCLCHSADAAYEQPSPQPEAADLAEAHKVIEAGREAATNE